MWRDKEKARKWRRRKYEKLKADPLKYAKSLAQARKRAKSQRQDALRHAELLKYRQSYYQKKYKAPVDHCEICERRTRLDQDHCHSTGKLRGLICRSCNLVLGHAKDSPEILTEAIEYLARYN